MADNKSTIQRSQNMSAIRAKDTVPETYIRKLLFADGFRYRKNCGDIVGTPDLWLPKYGTVVFIHGCYWHRHQSCKYAYTPKSNTEFWNRKFQSNIQRDKNVQQKLSENGIRILIIWECTVKRMRHSPELAQSTLNQIEEFIRSNSPFMEI